MKKVWVVLSEKVTSPQFKWYLIKFEIKSLHLKARFSASTNEGEKNYTLEMPDIFSVLKDVFDIFSFTTM